MVLTKQRSRLCIVKWGSSVTQLFLVPPAIEKCCIHAPVVEGYDNAECIYVIDRQDVFPEPIMEELIAQKI